MSDVDFEAIFEEHKDAVYRFAWRMTNSPAIAEDIAQDVFLALLRGDAKLDRSRGSLRALLLGIARNLAWKRWRRDRRWLPMDDEAFIAKPLSVESLDAAQVVAAAIALLPALQREALILATYQELSLKEIAAMLGVEEGSVKARIHRARENLKRILAPHRPVAGRIAKDYGTVK